LKKKTVAEYVENLLLHQIRVQSTWPLRIEINYIVIVRRSHKLESESVHSTQSENTKTL